MNFKKVALITVLGLGLVLLVFQVVANTPIWWKLATTKVQHPASYNFAAYNKLLKNFVSDGLVDYQAMKKSSLLNEAVNELPSINPDKFPSKEARMCFWINAYNLLILKTICDHYPVQSLSDLKNTPNFTKYVIGGDVFSVKEILEVKLVDYFEADPLATFVVCGSCQGQPPLINHVIDTDNLKEDERENLRRFINDPRNYRYDDVTNTFSIAPYFENYADEYSAAFESPHALANAYRTQQIDVGRASLLTNYLREDNWELNDKALGRVDARGNKVNDKS